MDWGAGTASPPCPPLPPFPPLTSHLCTSRYSLFFPLQIVVLFYKVLIPGFSWIVMISIERLTAEIPPTFIYIQICFFSSAFLLHQSSVELFDLIISGTLPIKMCSSSKGWKWQWICLLLSYWGFHLNPVVLETSEFHWMYTHRSG